MSELACPHAGRSAIAIDQSFQRGTARVIDIITTGLESGEGKQMTMVKVNIEVESGDAEPKN